MDGSRSDLRQKLTLALAFIAVVVSVMSYLQGGGVGAQAAPGDGSIIVVETTLSDCKDVTSTGNDCALLGSNDVTNNDISRNSIESFMIFKNAVTSTDIQNAAIESRDIGTGQVKEDDLGPRLAPNSVIATAAGVDGYSSPFTSLGSAGTNPISWGTNFDTIEQTGIAVPSYKPVDWGNCLNPENNFGAPPAACLRVPTTGVYTVSLSANWSGASDGFRKASVFIDAPGPNSSDQFRFLSEQGETKWPNTGGTAASSLPQNQDGGQSQGFSTSVSLTRGDMVTVLLSSGNLHRTVDITLSLQK